MLDKEALKNLLHQSEISNTDKLLLCLAVNSDQAKQVKDIKATATDAGLRSVQKWNVSSNLARSTGQAIRTAKGWELTANGKKRIREIAGKYLKTPQKKVAVSLRGQLKTINNPDTYAFVEEAIYCFEAGLYRAAVVLSWVGAVSLLYEHVIKRELSAFNIEARRRNPKWKDAKTRDDLARMKEHDFLNVLETISVLGKSVKQELQNCLQLRNGCGHPNSLQIGENRVTAHIEVLILNVFSQFSV